MRHNRSSVAALYRFHGRAAGVTMTRLTLARALHYVCRRVAAWGAAHPPLTGPLEPTTRDPWCMTAKQESLLLYLGAPGTPQEFMDPIRIMKGLFLFAQEAPQAFRKADGVYDFEPYHYGPCAFQIYDDLATLERAGILASQQVPGRSWKQYAVSEAGRKHLSAISGTWNPGAVEYLGVLKRWCASQTFTALLNAVYQKYPQYAVYSVFRR